VATIDIVFLFRRTPGNMRKAESAGAAPIQVTHGGREAFEGPEGKFVYLAHAVFGRWSSGAGERSWV
jgi:hypothetical protein